MEWVSISPFSSSLPGPQMGWEQLGHTGQGTCLGMAGPSIEVVWIPDTKKPCDQLWTAVGERKFNLSHSHIEFYCRIYIKSYLMCPLYTTQAISCVPKNTIFRVFIIFHHVKVTRISSFIQQCIYWVLTVSRPLYKWWGSSGEENSWSIHPTSRRKAINKEMKNITPLYFQIQYAPKCVAETG